MCQFLLRFARPSEADPYKQPCQYNVFIPDVTSKYRARVFTPSLHKTVIRCFIIGAYFTEERIAVFTKVYIIFDKLLFDFHN